MDIIKEIEKQKDNFYNKRVERNKYLGEYKERVIVALTKDEVREKKIYIEVENALKTGKANKILISNEIDLKKIKKYIYLSKKYKINLKKIDTLSFVGDIGLVVCSKDKYTDNDEYNPMVKSKLERFIEKGYPSIYFEAQGCKISKFYYEIIKKEFPDLINDYEEINLFEKILGAKCPIYEKLGGKIK